MRGLQNAFTRIYINEESIEEDEAINSAEKTSNRSLINEDKERRGEQFDSQNVTPQ